MIAHFKGHDYLRVLCEIFRTVVELQALLSPLQIRNIVSQCLGLRAKVNVKITAIQCKGSLPLKTFCKAIVGSGRLQGCSERESGRRGDYVNSVLC